VIGGTVANSVKQLPPPVGQTGADAVNSVVDILAPPPKSG
jgi:hypothetical protein